MTRSLLILAIVCVGCRKKAPEAPEAFTDAIIQLFVQFDEDADLVAENLAEVERQIYLGMDVDADKAVDRALEPEHLKESDVAHLDPRPRDFKPADALPIAVAGISAFDIDDHKHIQLLPDHTPVEPFSPDHYNRTFLEGEDCWADQGCDLLLTWNELTKKNALMEVEYGFFKDFRWVDLAATGDGPRWAYIARSWDDKSYEGDSGKSWIHQGYTIEVWIPRDGGGYLRSPKDNNADDGEWTGDSDASGILHMLALWSETEFKGFNFPDDAVITTTRQGMDDNFKAAEEWLEGQ